jgi:hypothetical protein
VLACLLLSGVSWAQDAVVEGLGQATLAIEEDNTRLNLFNLGNPAGAAFLPQKNRLDLSVNLDDRERTAEFATGADGSPANVAPFGNTLTPASYYTRKVKTLTAGLNQDLPGGYGGALLALNDEVTLQIMPVGALSQRNSTDVGTSLHQQSGGGALRAAWQLDPHWALGAGVSGASSWEKGWQDLDWTSQFSVLPFTLSQYQQSENDFAAEAGAVWRTEAIFDSKDYFDLGVVAQGQRQATQTLFLDSALGNPVSNTQYDGWTLPWNAHVQGLYSFQSVMELSLEAGYVGQQWYRSLAESGLPGEAEHKSLDLENVDYELAFRLRLPMVRNDDLRFGVVFNNRGFDHPYPTGHLLTYGSDGLYSQPAIDTLSSSIGIGVAFVPAEHSIVTLEYHLGTSKSRQDQPAGSLPGSEIVADSGFTHIVFGAQYSLIENLVLRIGFSSLKASYQNRGTTIDPATGELVLITHSSETAGISGGLGLDEGPVTINLTLTGQRVLNGPPGWTMLDKPEYAGDATQDTDQSLMTVLGVTWKF